MLAALVGGLGFAPSVNLGDDIAIFEAVHGSAPDIAGRGVANPIGAILSGALLLRHAGRGGDAAHREAAARRIEAAVAAALAGGCLTADLATDSRAALSTEEMTRAIVQRLSPAATARMAAERPANRYGATL